MQKFYGFLQLQTMFCKLEKTPFFQVNTEVTCFPLLVIQITSLPLQTKISAFLI